MKQENNKKKNAIHLLKYILLVSKFGNINKAVINIHVQILSDEWINKL